MPPPDGRPSRKRMKTDVNTEGTQKRTILSSINEEIKVGPDTEKEGQEDINLRQDERVMIESPALGENMSDGKIGVDVGNKQEEEGGELANSTNDA